MYGSTPPPSCVHLIVTPCTKGAGASPTAENESPTALRCIPANSSRVKLFARVHGVDPQTPTRDGIRSNNHLRPHTPQTPVSSAPSSTAPSPILGELSKRKSLGFMQTVWRGKRRWTGWVGWVKSRPTKTRVVWSHILQERRYYDSCVPGPRKPRSDR